MSVVCEEFGCTPDIAMRQDLVVVRRILDYRAAMMAKEKFNDKDKGAAFDFFHAHPRLLEVLTLMSRAQRGLPLHVGDAAKEGASIAQAHIGEIDEEIEDAG